MKEERKKGEKNNRFRSVNHIAEDFIGNIRELHYFCKGKERKIMKKERKKTKERKMAKKTLGFISRKAISPSISSLIRFSSSPLRRRKLTFSTPPNVTKSNVAPRYRRHIKKSLSFSFCVCVRCPRRGSIRGP